MAVAAKVRIRDEIRQAAVAGRLDLAAILAQLGWNLGEPEERVDLGLGGEGAELGGLPGRGLAVLAQAEEPLLRQAPAAVARDPAEPDVVFLAAGEVDEIRARVARRERH